VTKQQTSGRGTPARILVAGAGVAGAEAMLALRKLVGDRVSLAVLAPERKFPYRPLAVAAPFGHEGTPCFDITELTNAVGAELHTGRLAAVDPKRRLVTTADGEELGYDILLLATGATPTNALPGSLSFHGDRGSEAFRSLLGELDQGMVTRLVFALPARVGWPLPLYELALLTSAYLARGRHLAAELALVTHEDAPLDLFGRNASEAVRALLVEHQIELHTGRHPISVDDRGLVMSPRGLVRADRVVSLPRLEGPRLPGLPCDAAGFLPTDWFGRLVGVSDVYAAGDVTAFPVKQGGIAAQQADAAAEAIAARLGATVTPAPFEPVLRGLLLTGTAPRFLQAEISGGHGETSTVAHTPLWWPPTKVAARHLGPLLASKMGLELPGRPPRVEAIPVEVDLAEHGSGDLERSDPMPVNAPSR
jgi:sulfide:quinone oxidoreductase